MKEGGKKKKSFRIECNHREYLIELPYGCRHLVILRLIRGIQFALISGYTPRRSYTSVVPSMHIHNKFVYHLVLITLLVIDKKGIRFHSNSGIYLSDFNCQKRKEKKFFSRFLSPDLFSKFER